MRAHDDQINLPSRGIFDDLRFCVPEIDQLRRLESRAAKIFGNLAYEIHRLLLPVLFNRLDLRGEMRENIRRDIDADGFDHAKNLDFRILSSKLLLKNS